MTSDTWQTTIYVLSAIDREELFRLLCDSRLGAAGRFHTVSSPELILEVRRNPDSSADSPFGHAPVLIEVARPEGTKQIQFLTAYQKLIELLQSKGIPFAESWEIGL